MVVGAPYATVGANADQGAVYVYVKPSSGTWADAVETAKLTASDGAAGDSSAGRSRSTATRSSRSADRRTRQPDAGRGLRLHETGRRLGQRDETARLTASDGNGIDSVGSRSPSPGHGRRRRAGRGPELPGPGLRVHEAGSRLGRRTRDRVPRAKRFRRGPHAGLFGRDLGRHRRRRLPRQERKRPGIRGSGLRLHRAGSRLDGNRRANGRADLLEPAVRRARRYSVGISGNRSSPERPAQGPEAPTCSSSRAGAGRTEARLRS